MPYDHLREEKFWMFLLLFSLKTVIIPSTFRKTKDR